MLSESVTSVAQGEHCTKTTDTKCGSVGARAGGCTFRPFLGPGASPTATSSAASSAKSPNASAEADAKTSHRKTVIAEAVGIPFGFAVLCACVFYYIVLPWMRGATRRSDAGCGPAESSRVPCSRAASFLDEHDYVEYDQSAHD
jgi:hypothetical protein